MGTRCARRSASVTDDGLFRVMHDGRVGRGDPRPAAGGRLPDVPPEAPRERPERRRAACRARPTRPRRRIPTRRCERLLDAPTIASKRWVYEQYDSTVRASTVLGPGGDAGVLRVPGTDVRPRGDGRLQRAATSASIPTRAARPRWPRRRATSPAPAPRPLGITDCLNFGNPEKPEVFFQFSEACRGIGDACRAFGTPVTGGNVSLYNESPHGRDRSRRRPSAWSGCSPTSTPRACRAISSAPATRSCSWARPRASWAARAYWADVLGFVGGAPPPVDLDGRAPPAGRSSSRPPSAGCCARRTTAATAASPSRWPRRHRRAVRGRRLGRGVDLAGYAAGAGADPAAVRRRRTAACVVSAAPRRRRRPRAPWRALHRRCRVRARAASATRARSRRASVRGAERAGRCASGDATRRIHVDAIPRAAWRRGAAGGLSACAASSAYPASRTRRGSPISVSTPCSTAARRAPASSRSTRTDARGSTAAWGWCRRPSPSRRSPELARRRRGRPHPLLHRGQHGPRERPAAASPTTARGPLSLAHNGNLTNADELRASWSRQGAIFTSITDTEVIVHLIARSHARRRWKVQIREALEQVEGAYSPGDRRRPDPLRRRRPARLPAARHRPAGRRGDRRLGDLRARPGGRHDRSASCSRAIRPDRRRRDRDLAPLPPPAGQPLRLRAGLLRPARQPRCSANRSTGCAASWAAQLAREHPAPGAEVVFSVPDSLQRDGAGLLARSPASSWSTA